MSVQRCIDEWNSGKSKPDEKLIMWWKGITTYTGEKVSNNIVHIISELDGVFDRYKESLMECQNSIRLSLENMTIY